MSELPDPEPAVRDRRGAAGVNVPTAQGDQPPTTGAAVTDLDFRLRDRVGESVGPCVCCDDVLLRVRWWWRLRQRVAGVLANSPRMRAARAGMR